jgi:hypothetical protein
VAAARYVALNPVRARLVAHAQDWPWSSARVHLAGRDDGLVRVAPLIERVGRFADLIGVDPDFDFESSGTRRMTKSRRDLPRVRTRTANPNLKERRLT